MFGTTLPFFPPLSGFTDHSRPPLTVLSRAILTLASTEGLKCWTVKWCPFLQQGHVSWNAFSGSTQLSQSYALRCRRPPTPSIVVAHTDSSWLTPHVLLFWFCSAVKANVWVLRPAPAMQRLGSRGRFGLQSIDSFYSSAEATKILVNTFCKRCCNYIVTLATWIRRGCGSNSSELSISRRSTMTPLKKKEEKDLALQLSTVVPPASPVQYRPLSVTAV